MLCNSFMTILSVERFTVIYLAPHEWPVSIISGPFLICVNMEIVRTASNTLEAMNLTPRWCNDNK